MMFDIAVIGAGPVGLFTVFQSGMLGLKCAVIDALGVVGGQCSALYPEKPIYDIPGYPKILAQDLIDSLMAQAAPFTPSFLLNQEVLHIEQDDNRIFTIKTSVGNSVHAKIVIIAAGCGAFGPNRPSVDNIMEFENTSVFYSVTRRDLFVGKKVVIAGGGDSAVDWALSLSQVAEKIYIVHRRNKFRASPESLRQLQELSVHGNIEMVVPFQLHSIKGSGGNLSSVAVVDFDQNIKELQADYLLPFFGLSMTLGPIMDWKLEIDNKHIKVNQSTMETNIPGIFAVGDIAHYSGKLKLILTGFAETAVACHRAYAIINNGVEMHFEHSTTKGIPVL